VAKSQGCPECPASSSEFYRRVCDIEQRIVGLLAPIEHFPDMAAENVPLTFVSRRLLS